MKYLTILFIVTLIGCNGELEVKPGTESHKIKDAAECLEAVKPEKLVKISKPIQKATKKAPLKFNRKARLRDGYKVIRYYGRRNCNGKVYEKEFAKSFFYIFVDCNNNYTTQRMRK